MEELKTVEEQVNLYLELEVIIRDIQFCASMLDLIEHSDKGDEMERSVKLHSRSTLVSFLVQHVDELEFNYKHINLRQIRC